jgi:hypothetical protein
MTPLPVEETLFAQTYLSEAETEAGGPAGSAGVGLFSVDPSSRSLFHRLAFDELWHFYAGDPLRLVLLYPDGSDDEVVLGGDPFDDLRVQHLVPAGVWQAGEVAEGGRWSLFGCTMAPGFTAASFEGGSVEELRATYPSRAEDIERLAIPPDRPLEMPAGFPG